MGSITISITVNYDEPSEQTMQRLRGLVADLRAQPGVRVDVRDDPPTERDNGRPD